MSNMYPSVSTRLAETYPICHAFLTGDGWDVIVGGCSAAEAAQDFIDSLKAHTQGLGLPAYLPELARLELIKAETAHHAIPAAVSRRVINPTLNLFEASWKGLSEIIGADGSPAAVSPEEGREITLVWRNPADGRIQLRGATDEELLVLKIVAEELDGDDVARSAGIPVGIIDWAFDRAIDNGLILNPPSLISRNTGDYTNTCIGDEAFLSSPFFTVQWHITQACDLHCRHCYDRSSRSPLQFDEALRILDDIRTFCRDRHVLGQISFSGGNPFLYPRFFDLYEAAAERGFVTAILGNPVSREAIERMLALQRPAFYQVSLEGLEEHNDYMRGRGHFNRVLQFLDMLHDYGIQSQVMLTLTRDNRHDVIPLADVLRDRADLFTFNRLARVGEAVTLSLPTHGEYRDFVDDYLEAAQYNPVMGLKDNLINIVLHERGMEPFGGCAGYGCSAAFNFVALLPDGEVHACRKFPSLIGNIHTEGMAEIYDSLAAHRYRAGSDACRACPIRPVCGGCLAVMYGEGLDIFEARDPHCFMDLQALAG